MEIIDQHFESISSTQTYARNHVSCMHPDQFFIISADLQTHGIGQRSKKWSSPGGGNIYVSYVCLLPLKQQMLFLRYPSVIALCIVDTLDAYGIKGRIKWVNDVLVEEKKIAGILCENQGTSSDHPNYFKAIIGIGLNVNMLPKNIDQPVTSMARETHINYNVKSVFDTLNKMVIKHIPNLQNNGPSYLYDRIDTYWEFLNQMVTITLATGENIFGVFKGVRPEDGACIIDNNKRIHYVRNGHLKSKIL
jgi:BirA family biotin operon repressor/biotin-[acetyl-CoA-carboxylase] ligase